MQPPDQYILVSRLGQILRQEGRQLRVEAVRRAIACGRIDALRVGGRWGVKLADGRAFSLPLVEGAE